MLFIIQSIIICILFTIVVVVPLLKNPIGQIMSFPLAVRKRVESLPQYQDVIEHKKKRHIGIKIIAVFAFILVLAIVAYFSGVVTFNQAFVYVFGLFLVVTLYDLIIIDLLLFRNWKKLWIPGTEDMIDVYRDPYHHILGAGVGLIIGIVVSFLSALFVHILNTNILG